CVVLAVALVGWQLNRRAVAEEEAKQMRAQLLAAQLEAADAQSELEQMQAGFVTLQQTSAQRYEAALQAIESASAFEVWKQKTRSRLLAVDYRWDEDSAFVRIPKTLLLELTESRLGLSVSPPGVVNERMRELLGLTTAERQTLEDNLQRVAELQAGG